MLFSDLISSRRRWIDEVLKPWCRQALTNDLLLAEQIWVDLAGQVNPQVTLWMWAWSRFPGLIVAELDRFDEAAEVLVRLHDGTEFSGSPDGRHSHKNLLTLAALGSTIPPLSLDAIASIQPVRQIVPVPSRSLTPSPDSQD